MVTQREYDEARRREMVPVTGKIKGPLSYSPIGFDVTAIRDVYDLAVRISQRTPKHGLCCTHIFQGETPVTDAEIKKAREIVAKTGHEDCRAWVYALSYRGEGLRRSVRRVISSQGYVPAHIVEHLERCDMERRAASLQNFLRLGAKPGGAEV